MFPETSEDDQTADGTDRRPGDDITPGEPRRVKFVKIQLIGDFKSATSGCSVVPGAPLEDSTAAPPVPSSAKAVAGAVAPAADAPAWATPAIVPLALRARVMALLIVASCGGTIVGSLAWQSGWLSTLRIEDASTIDVAPPPSPPDATYNAGNAISAAPAGQTIDAAAPVAADVGKPASAPLDPFSNPPTPPLADATSAPAASLATVEAPALATPAPWVFASPAVESHGVTGSPQDQTAPPSVTARISAADTVRPPLADTAMPPVTGRPSLPAGTRIVLRAKADSWLQVRDRQGPVLLNRVLRTGETWLVPPSQSPAQLLLSTGNAGGTEVLVDGDLTAALGKDGEVRRNLLLDPDTIRDGRLASRSAMPRKAD